MGSIKLQSFEDFAAASKATAEAKIQEKQKAARTESAYKFETLLSEFGVTSVKDLNEEDRGKFFAKLGASEVSESLAIIEEGTRSQIGKIKKNGKITSVYMHYDGYPEHMLPTIKKGYKDGKAVDTLLKNGGGSGLEADPSEINFYGDKATIAGDIKNLNKYISHADYNGGAEFIYLFDERDGEWYMVDVYGKQELVPAFESLFINEAFTPSKGNLRDAKKVAKFLEGFFTQHSALSSSNSFLGVCRYLLSEALGDANFHSYRDPVSNALGGKISTIMVDIDNLGGMSIPVGKKAIVNLLDEHYSDLANAAGWSGIGIVEGMALFLDGFGYAQQAQKIVDAFELIWANESVMNEGNAFLAARAKAIEEDALEFEFNGKTYPVVTEGNAFGAARAEAIAKGEKTFKVGDEEYPVEDVSKEDEENAKEFVEESLGVNEGDAKQFETDMADMIKNIKSGYGWIDPDYVADTWDNSSDSIDFELVKGEIYKRLIAAKLLAYADDEDEEEAGKYIKSLKELGIKESVVTEARYNKKSLLKKLGSSHDAIIQTGNGKEYIIYNPDSNNDDNAAMWNDDSVFAVDQDGEEHEIAYKDIGLVMVESVVNEAKVKSDEDFKEYAFTVLGKAFGDKFDEEKAQEVVDGLLSKHGDDYGAAVGALTSSLG